MDGRRPCRCATRRTSTGHWRIAFRLLRRPWVFDHHDLSPEVYATRSNGRPNKYVFGLLVFFERMTLRTASAVFATNESFRENAERRGVAGRAGSRWCATARAATRSPR